MRNNRSILGRLLSELNQSNSGETIELPWLGYSEPVQAGMQIDADFPKSEPEEFEHPKLRTFSVSSIGDFWEERQGVTAFQYNDSPLGPPLLVALSYADFKTKVFPPE